MVQDQISLLEAVLPFYKTAHFDQLFRQLFGSLTRNQQFMLKMELHRLAGPASRIIDLRPKLPEGVPCNPHEYHGRTHHLDDLGLEHFEQQCKLYGNRYTLGVYESVLDFHRYRKPDVEQEDETDPLANLPTVDQFDLSELSARRWERTFVSLEVKATLGDDRQATGTVIDISAGGARLRLPAHVEVDPDQQLQLHFEQWQQEVLFDIVATERKGAHQQVRLSCDSPNENYLQHVERLISLSRSRHRLDMAHATQISLKHALQHACIKSLPHMPLYVCDTGKGPVVRYGLQTEGNRALFEQWFWDGQQQLQRLLPAARLKRLLRDEQVDDLVLCFQFTRNDQRHTYAALASELEMAKLTTLFIAFGSRQSYWQLFQLRAIPLDPALAERPSPSPQLPEHGFTVPEAMVPAIGSMTHLIQLSPLPKALCDQYRDKLHSKQSPNSLNPFWLRPQKESKPLELIDYGFLNLRQEPRYVHRSPITLQEPGGSPITGVTRNISARGMQVELDQAIYTDPGEGVKLSLDGLQKLSRDHNLMDLPYIVRALSSDGTFVRVSIDDDSLQPHPAPLFFSDVITQNQDKLRELPYILHLEPFAAALANLYAASFGHMMLLLSKQGHSLQLKQMIVANPADNGLEPLQEHPGGDYIRPAWLNANWLQENMLPAWRNITVGRGSQLLYLPKLHPKLELQLTATQPPKELRNLLADELAFIGFQANHKAQEIESLLESLAMVVDMLPNTQETAFRERWLKAPDPLEEAMRAV